MEDDGCSIKIVGDDQHCPDEGDGGDGGGGLPGPGGPLQLPEACRGQEGVQVAAAQRQADDDSSDSATESRF